MKLKFIAILLCITIIMLSGCQIFPSPDKTITAPRPVSDISSDNNDVTSIISGFLPEGSMLLSPKDNSSLIPYAEKDLDGDGINEIIFTYKNVDDQVISGLMVLKKGAKSWYKLYDKTDNKNTIYSVKYEDITGDNHPEIFVQYPDTLRVYHFYNNQLHEVFNNICTNYTISDIKGSDGYDGMKELSVKYNNLSYLNISVYRWDGMSFINVGNEFPESFMEQVNYYKEKVKDSPEIEDYWSGLISALQEVNMNREALKTIDEALRACNLQREDDNFTELKATSLINLGCFEEARSLLSKEPKKYSALIAESYEEEGNFTKAREVYKSISNYPYDFDLQRMDVFIDENKIFKFLSKSGSTQIEKYTNILPEWGKEQNLVINCINAKDNGSSSLKVLLVDFIIDPSKAYGKNNIGAHIIYWWKAGKLYHQLFITMGQIEYPEDHPLAAAYTAKQAELANSNNFIKLKINFINSRNDKNLPNHLNQSLILQDNKWKLFWN